MKAELRLAKHVVLLGEAVVEIWWNGEFIGQVVGADGPGVRVISKYPKVAVELDALLVEVRMLVP